MCYDDALYKFTFYLLTYLQAPGDATFGNGFSAITSLFFPDSILESVNFLRVAICKFSIFVMVKAGHRLSRLAKGTPSESRLFVSTIGLG